MSSKTYPYRCSECDVPGKMTIRDKPLEDASFQCRECGYTYRSTKYGLTKKGKTTEDILPNAMEDFLERLGEIRYAANPTANHEAWVVSKKIDDSYEITLSLKPKATKAQKDRP